MTAPKAVGQAVGWSTRSAAPRAHYFKSDRISLCGHYKYGGGREVEWKAFNRPCGRCAPLVRRMEA